MIISGKKHVKLYSVVFMAPHRTPVLIGLKGVGVASTCGLITCNYQVIY